MRPCSAAMRTFLDDPTNLAVFMADLYTIVLSGGETFRWSGADLPLTIPAAGFPTGSINVGANRTFTLGPKFGPSKVSTKVGIEPTTLALEIIADANDLIGSQTIADCIQQGQFDGATVELDRFLAPPPSSLSSPVDTSLGVIVWFYGRVSECEIGRSKIRMNVKSLLNLLNIQQMPRRIRQAACNHVFGAPMCGYDRTLGKNALGASTGIGRVNITAASGSNQGEIKASFSPSPATIYNEGSVVGLTGANAGYSRTISSVSGGSVFVVREFLFPVTAGDTFYALPGCDHTVATCNGPLNNFLRYGGTPYTPPPEFAV